MRQLAPSILAADFNQLGRQIKELEENKIELLHIDVMDGMFVPSISFGMPLIASIRKESSLFFDVHLMVQEPIRYIKEFAKAGADSLTVHVEACEDVEETLRQIKAQGISCGISLNPETPVASILPYLSLADVVLVMSVHPGFGGQKLIPEALEKVKRLAKIKKEKALSYHIEIDGGVNQENLSTVLTSGADWIVAGTAVFEGDISENIRMLKGVTEYAS